MVYESKDKATVFIGSSRIKFDLDIPTWESLTGNHAIQLANVGSSPRPVMEDLANDPNFKGRLVVDVTEGLFFYPGLALYDGSTNKKIRYYPRHHTYGTIQFPGGSRARIEVCFPGPG